MGRKVLFYCDRCEQESCDSYFLSDLTLVVNTNQMAQNLDWKASWCNQCRDTFTKLVDQFLEMPTKEEK